MSVSGACCGLLYLRKIDIDMERLMRRAERAKQEFLQEQTEGGFTSRGRDVLTDDRQTRPNVQPARLGMSSEQALKATFVRNTEHFGVLELLKVTQKLLDDYYAGQQLGHHGRLSQLYNVICTIP